MLYHRTPSAMGLLALVAVAVTGCAADFTSSAVVPPPPPPAGTRVMLQTTLDDLSAVTAPSIGTSGGIVSTTPANDFVAAQVGDGLRTDAVGERVLFPQISNGVKNVENESGTLEFWYRPSYDHDQDKKYTIAGTGTWKPGNTTAGSIHLGKHNLSNQLLIFLILFDANGVRWEHNVSANDYGWNAGEWHLIRVTWDMNVSSGEQNMRLYLDGQELPLIGDVSRGPQPALPESESEFIYIGARDLTGSISAGGVYDEVRIWDRAIPPS